MIHISLSPNLEIDDVWLSLKWLVSPSRWSSKNSQEKLKRQLLELFPQAKAIFLLNSGRSALMLGLKALRLPKNSKVLLQAFTCSAVPNSILWNHLVPEYLDIQRGDYNLNTESLPPKPRAKALVVQHTFGQPADLAKIIAYCQKNKLYLIEDCAHSLGARYRGKLTGSFGDMAMLTFGRDKVISSVFGGALIINNKNLVKPIENLYQNLTSPPTFWTLQQLLHPLITYFAKKTYSFYLGRIVLVLAQKAKLISKAIYPQEHHHQTPPIFPSRLPESLADLAGHQLLKLDRFNKRRRQIATYYHHHLNNPLISKPAFGPEGIYLRYTILLDQPEKLKLHLKRHGVIIEKRHWYTQPVTPSNDLALVNYRMGQCPIVEEACRRCLNLPTGPLMTTKEAEDIVKLINQWQS